MTTFYSLLADFVVALHFAYVGFVVLGLLLVLLGRLFHWRWVSNPWFRLIHLTMMGIVVVESLLGITCPLTDWEKALRHAAGQTVDEGSFMGRLMHNLIFYEAGPQTFTLIYVLFFTLLVASFFLVPIRFERRPRAHAS
jgi:hypothetical protein